MKRVLAAGTLLICSLVCQSATDDGLPSLFWFELGDAFTHAYRVELREGELYYYASRLDSEEKRTEPVKIGATAGQWRDFRAALDRCAVWTWQEKYDGHAFDGWGWGIRVQYRDSAEVDQIHHDLFGDSLPNYESSFFHGQRNV